MSTNVILFMGVALATLILISGEFLKNETKAEYVKRGHKWSSVLIVSTVMAVILGLISAYILQDNPKMEDLNLYLIPFAVTVVAYITVQSYMTDMKILMINRNILRVAYISMYIATMYNIFSNEIFRSNLIPVIAFTILIGVLFIFSSIGASDIRAIAVAMPFVISIGGFEAVLWFVYTLIAVAIGMEIRNTIKNRKRMKKFKEDNKDTYEKMNKLLFYKLARSMIQREKTEEELATPVGPFMIAPFLVFLIVYPFLIN